MTINDMIKTYGKNKTALIVEHSVRRTIIETKRKKQPKKQTMFMVIAKNPIPGRLELAKEVPLCLFSPDKRSARSVFYAEEVKRMLKTMPNFNKYYRVVEVESYAG